MNKIELMNQMLNDLKKAKPNGQTEKISLALIQMKNNKVREIPDIYSLADEINVSVPLISQYCKRFKIGGYKGFKKIIWSEELTQEQSNKIDNDLNEIMKKKRELYGN